MPLIVLSEERVARELARCVANERRGHAETRRLVLVAGAMALGVLAEVFFFGLSMHLTGEPSLAATSVALLCGVAPLFIIIFAQLRSGD